MEPVKFVCLGSNVVRRMEEQKMWNHTNKKHELILFALLSNVCMELKIDTLNPKM